MNVLQYEPMTLAEMLRRNLVHLRDMGVVEVISYVVFGALLFALVLHLGRTRRLWRLVRVPQLRAAQAHREVFNSSLSVVLYNAVQLVTRMVVLAFGYIITLDRPMPIWEFALSLPLVIVVHDAYFYWTHRFMHLKQTFRLFHWEHHKSREPTVFTAYSFAVPEAIVQGLFGVFYVALFPATFTTLIFFYAVEIAHTVAIHSGFEFGPRAWVTGRFGWLCGATHHDLHHRTARGNYGLYFRFWDRVMNTEHPDFERIYAHVVSPQNDGHGYRLLGPGAGSTPTAAAVGATKSEPAVGA